MVIASDIFAKYRQKGVNVIRIVYVDEQNLATLQQIAPSLAMALGYFDGVHRGHQHVIEQAKQQGQLLV